MPVQVLLLHLANLHEEAIGLHQLPPHIVAGLITADNVGTILNSLF
jgi:hypothetical protein